MRGVWDEAVAVKAGAELDWLPPFTEWDFRSIREKESRMACCWEYARNAAVICNSLTGWLDGAGGLTTLGNFICTEGVRFPEPWVLCGDELRYASELVEDNDSPVTVYAMKPRKEFVLQEVAAALEEGRDVLEELDRLLLDQGQAMVFDFERCGTEAVLKAVSQVVRQEAKNHPRARRGKGAAPPFEWLKWLAALRLEGARQEAGVSFGEMQAALARHQREFPIAGASPTLPLYSGHGAWSKAISDARKALALLETDPLKFERRILLF